MINSPFFWPVVTLILGVLGALLAACYWRIKHNVYVVRADNRIERL